MVRRVNTITMLNLKLTIFGTKMLQERKGVFDTRLADSGFKGACLALVAAGKVEAIRPKHT